MKLSLSRRDLLAFAALTAASRALGAAPAAGAAEASLAGGAPPGAPPPRGVAPGAMRTLEAACARILPSDDGPGAREANVIRFIERQLDGPLRRLRPAMEQGALLLDRWSRKRFGDRPFAQLDAAQQDDVLGQLSRAEIPVKSFPQAELFRALHALTLEGFLSDPAHGGNDREAGWRAIGFAAPGLRHAHH